MPAIALRTESPPLRAVASDCSATRAESAAFCETCTIEVDICPTASLVSVIWRDCSSAAASSSSELARASDAACVTCSDARLMPWTNRRSSSMA